MRRVSYSDTARMGSVPRLQSDSPIDFSCAFEEPPDGLDDGGQRPSVTIEYPIPPPKGQEVEVTTQKPLRRKTYHAVPNEKTVITSLPDIQQRRHSGDTSPADHAPLELLRQMKEFPQLVASNRVVALVINNNPNGDAELRNHTPKIIELLKEAGAEVHEARTGAQVNQLAQRAKAHGWKPNLIVTCGSSVVLTDPVDISLHVSKTTAAMLAFPEAVLVGVCYGMQLLTLLHGGVCIEKKALRPPSMQGHEILKKVGESTLLQGLLPEFPAFCTNFIFCQLADAPGIRVTAVDRHNHPMALEHENGKMHAVQFHPEEMGPGGRCVIQNMMRLASSCGIKVDQ